MYGIYKCLTTGCNLRLKEITAEDSPHVGNPVGCPECHRPMLWVRAFQGTLTDTIQGILSDAPQFIVEPLRASINHIAIVYLPAESDDTVRSRQLVTVGQQLKHAGFKVGFFTQHGETATDQVNHLQVTA